MPYWVLKTEDIPFTPPLPAELRVKARGVPTPLLGPRPCQGSSGWQGGEGMGAGNTLVSKGPWQCALVILSCSSLQLLGTIHTSTLRAGQAYLFSRLFFSPLAICHSPALLCVPGTLAFTPPLGLVPAFS